mmetsp:Transcript_43642/g.115321  ORF Transcript_43642/g.115321 Transcript_43642/m.115321 type:complete len:208 (+) Transcript_43642:1466-2089(+)
MPRTRAAGFSVAVQIVAMCSVWLALPSRALLLWTMPTTRAAGFHRVMATTTPVALAAARVAGAAVEASHHQWRWQQSRWSCSGSGPGEHPFLPGVLGTWQHCFHYAAIRSMSLCECRRNRRLLATTEPSCGQSGGLQPRRARTKVSYPSNLARWCVLGRARSAKLCTYPLLTERNARGSRRLPELSRPATLAAQEMQLRRPLDRRQH